MDDAWSCLSSTLPPLKHLLPTTSYSLGFWIPYGKELSRESPVVQVPGTGSLPSSFCLHIYPCASYFQRGFWVLLLQRLQVDKQHWHSSFGPRCCTYVLSWVLSQFSLVLPLWYVSCVSASAPKNTVPFTHLLHDTHCDGVKGA